VWVDFTSVTSNQFRNWNLGVVRYQVRTANLLGVAGTDIPVTELKKRTPAYKVCSHMRNNPFHFLMVSCWMLKTSWKSVGRQRLLVHSQQQRIRTSPSRSQTVGTQSKIGYPQICQIKWIKSCFIDLKQDADGLLKPNYNTVDLSEIELVDSDGGPRENDTNLMTVSCDDLIINNLKWFIIEISFASYE
jgi:hypothetical protein